MKSQHSNTPLFPYSNFTTYISSTLKYLLIISAVYFIGAFLWVALHRIGYPFELEWQEGAIVDHCRRIISGRPLYASPDLTFTPFFYPPLFFYLSGWLMKIIGIGFFAPRLVSFIASLGVLLLIFVTVWRETGSPLGALLASGLFAAAYRATGAWLDIARVDSLFLFWLALGVFWARRGEGKWNVLITAFIFSLAFHTKQFALLPALAIGGYYFFRDRRQFFIYCVTLGAGIGGGILLLNYHYHGWYSYYVFELPAGHNLVKKQLQDFWLKDISRTFPVAFAGMIYFWFAGARDLFRGRENTRRLFYILLSISLLLVGWLGRGNVNSYSNTLIPVVFAFSLLLGMEAGQWWRKITTPPLPPAVLLIFNGLLFAQFILLLYLPGGQIPPASDRQAGASFIRFMRQVPGDVFVPYHGFLPFLAGKETSAHWVGILDVLIAGMNSKRDCARVLLKQLEDALREGKYEVLILDREDWFPDLIKNNYKKQGMLFSDQKTFYPVTGYRTRPQYLYRKIFPRPVR